MVRHRRLHCRLTLLVLGPGLADGSFCKEELQIDWAASWCDCRQVLKGDHSAHKQSNCRERAAANPLVLFQPMAKAVRRLCDAYA